MANIDAITKRAVMHSAALATLGSDPAWDKALNAYLRADTLQQADAECGALYAATDKFRRFGWSLESKYGPNWSNVPQAKAEHKPAYDEMQAAENKWAEVYCKPHWRASRELALTPAPTVAAAVFKANMIEHEDLPNDHEFPADCMEILHADFARLEA